MDYREFSAKTVNDCITDACTSLGVPSDRLDYEVIFEGSNGFMGIGSKPAVIKARIKEEVATNIENVVEEKKPEKPVEKKEVKKEDKKEEKKAEPVKEEKPVEKKEEEPKKAKVVKNIPEEDIERMKADAKKFLGDVLTAMKLTADVTCEYSAEDYTMNVNIGGSDMGVLIGRRGQTLDSLQYLVSLVINKGTSEYVRVKVDTENYRARRKETLENLAKNMAFKVKRTRRPASLEPMNPYERRIIHSALQNDKYVTTHSEGDEPYRKVVITLKK